MMKQCVDCTSWFSPLLLHAPDQVRCRLCQERNDREMKPYLDRVRAAVLGRMAGDIGAEAGRLAAERVMRGAVTHTRVEGGVVKEDEIPPSAFYANPREGE